MRLFDVSSLAHTVLTLHLREHVVNNVVLNDAVEDVATNETEFAIDSRGGALNEGPVLGLVVRRIRMSVMQIGDGDYDRLAESP